MQKPKFKVGDVCFYYSLCNNESDEDNHNVDECFLQIFKIDGRDDGCNVNFLNNSPMALTLPEAQALLAKIYKEKTNA